MEEPRAIFRISGPELETQSATVTRGGLRVGRVPGNDLVLNHPLVSRQHMRVTWRDGAFWVEDLGSSNGTRLGDRRLEPNTPERLNPGDAVRVGPFVLTLERVEGLAPAELAPPLTVEEAAPAAPPLPPPMPSHLPEQSALGESEPAPPPELPEPRARRQAPPPERLPEESALPPSALPPSAPPPPPLDGDGRYPVGIPRDRSTWLRYLPSIYSEDGFTGRYLLIFESIMAPIVWMIDNFDLYLSPGLAPAEWLQWMAGWLDVVLLPGIPVERQRAILSEAGWLFLRRGTRAALERLLELYFGVKPDIIESRDRPCHFTVRLALGRGEAALSRAVAERLIESQKPAFADYTLEMT